MPDSSPDTLRELESLRHLLLFPDRVDIAALEKRLDALEKMVLEIGERTLLVSEILPDAVRRNHGVDSDLQAALQPDIEQVIHRSIRQDPTVFAEALYPVIGPVIRKMVQKLFESSKSTKFKPYRVEQMFLIHRVSGLVIGHAAAAGVELKDTDMVSGMLDAIRSFVQEAFDAHDFDGLRSMSVGDVNVRIEWSPLVVLAAVVRGIEPQGLQPAMQETLLLIHHEYETQLKTYDGDNQPFTGLTISLQKALKTGKRSEFTSKWNTWTAPVILTLALLLLVWMIVSARAASAWQGFLDAVAAEPGIVVIEQNRHLTNYRIRALRDPDSADPYDLLLAQGIDRGSVDAVWSSFYSDEPAIKLKRAQRLLNPPQGVTLDIDQRTLIAYGVVSGNWLDEAGKKLIMLDGIDHLKQAWKQNSLQQDVQ